MSTWRVQQECSARSWRMIRLGLHSSSANFISDCFGGKLRGGSEIPAARRFERDIESGWAHKPWARGGVPIWETTRMASARAGRPSTNGPAIGLTDSMDHRIGLHQCRTRAQRERSREVSPPPRHSASLPAGRNHASAGHNSTTLRGTSCRSRSGRNASRHLGPPR